MKYTCINIQGNLVSEEILQKVETAEIQGQSAADFWLEPGGNLRREIEYAWSRIKLDWKQFNEKIPMLPASDPYGTTMTRRWMKGFFSTLGFEIRDQRTALEGSNNQSYSISNTSENLNDLPIHIVGFHEPAHPEKSTLDIRTGGGKSRYSPHGTMQEYLNVTEHLFGIVANGMYLRLMRDSGRLIKLTYIEFDLKRMLEEDKYSEFTLLYRLIHASRFPQTQEEGEQSWLQKYYLESIETGNRIRNGLSLAVKESLLALGAGFLQNEANVELREKIRSGALSSKDYYRQLLRIIYRLLFLLVTEERNLIYDSDDSKVTLHLSKIYWHFYSIARLRKLSEKHFLYESEFNDIWQGLVNTFRLFEAEGNGLKLGIAPLDGDLFSNKAIVDLQFAQISNKLLLTCIRNLNEFTDTNNNIVAINYRSLDVEELGSVYEGLLELHPVISGTEAARSLQFEFTFHEGTERKTTGSYYTRPELVNELIKSTLIPVIEERLKEAAGNKEGQLRALLQLKVCDAAAGSGHMLLAAARTIAWYFARIESGEENPAKSVFQKCLREIIQHCIYGVDMNPDAVELCKLALWLEGHNSGKPLSFLDHKIRNGNSLVGVTDLSVLQKGIPDNAYNPVTGDDREICKSLKKNNAAFNKTKQYSLFYQDNVTQDTLEFSNEYHELEDIRQDTVESVRRIKQKFELLRGNAKWWKDWRASNIWTAAFFFTYTEENVASAPTSERLQQFFQNPETAYGPMVEKALALSEEHKFFHWPLEFPDVFEQGGFDVMLGNPPWEKIRLEQQEFFSTRNVEIANAKNSSIRSQLISKLKEAKSQIYTQYQDAVHAADSFSKFIRNSENFKLTTSGDVNTFSLFSEIYTTKINKRGYSGFIVPTGIAVDDTNKVFINHIIESFKLRSLYDFQNSFGKDRFFKDVHPQFKFCLVTVSGSSRRDRKTSFGFYLNAVEQIQNPILTFQLSGDEIKNLNPNSRTCPVFRTSVDADLNAKIYSRVPIIKNKCNDRGSLGVVEMKSMFHMSNDSKLFRDIETFGEIFQTATSNPIIQLNDELYIPLIEGKMLDSYNHRFSSVIINSKNQKRKGQSKESTLNELLDASFKVYPQYWVNKLEVDRYERERPFLLLFKAVTGPSNSRTMIASIAPRHSYNHNVTEIATDNPILLISCLNSIIFDYFIRCKLNSNFITHSVLFQCPTPSLEAFSPQITARIKALVLELTYCSWDIKAFADYTWKNSDEKIRAAFHQQWKENEAVTGGHEWIAQEWSETDNDCCHLPPFKWDDDRRAIIKAELDAIYAQLYGLTTDELHYILDPQDVYGQDYPGETFRVLKDKEIRQYGEYRTKRLVLDAWNKLNNINTTSLNSNLENNMIDLSLHQGIYSIAETAIITRFSSQKVTSWFKELSKENYEGLDTKRALDISAGRISFHGLIELVVIGTLRNNGISLKKILKARADLSVKTHKIYPFATNNVKERLNVSGRDIIWDFGDMKVTLDGSSQVNIDFISQFFKDIIFTNDVAQRLMPAKGNKKVIIDPRIGLGKPVIIDKEVPVDIIASSYHRNPQSINKIKTEFGLTEEEIMAAISYMQ